MTEGQDNKHEMAINMCENLYKKLNGISTNEWETCSSCVNCSCNRMSVKDCLFELKELSKLIKKELKNKHNKKQEVDPSKPKREFTALNYRYKIPNELMKLFNMESGSTPTYHEFVSIIKNYISVNNLVIDGKKTIFIPNANMLKVIKNIGITYQFDTNKEISIPEFYNIVKVKFEKLN